MPRKKINPVPVQPAAPPAEPPSPVAGLTPIRRPPPFRPTPARPSPAESMSASEPDQDLDYADLPSTPGPLETKLMDRRVTQRPLQWKERRPAGIVKAEDPSLEAPPRQLPFDISAPLGAPNSPEAIASPNRIPTAVLDPDQEWTQEELADLSQATGQEVSNKSIPAPRPPSRLPAPVRMTASNLPPRQPSQPHPRSTTAAVPPRPVPQRPAPRSAPAHRPTAAPTFHDRPSPSPGAIFVPPPVDDWSEAQAAYYSPDLRIDALRTAYHTLGIPIDDLDPSFRDYLFDQLDIGDSFPVSFNALRAVIPNADGRRLAYTILVMAAYSALLTWSLDGGA